MRSARGVVRHARVLGAEVISGVVRTKHYRRAGDGRIGGRTSHPVVLLRREREDRRCAPIATAAHAIAHPRRAVLRAKEQAWLRAANPRWIEDLTKGARARPG